MRTVQDFLGPGVYPSEIQITYLQRSGRSLKVGGMHDHNSCLVVGDLTAAAPSSPVITSSAHKGTITALWQLMPAARRPRRFFSGCWKHRKDWVEAITGIATPHEGKFTCRHGACSRLRTEIAAFELPGCVGIAHSRTGIPRTAQPFQSSDSKVVYYANGSVGRFADRTDYQAWYDLLLSQGAAFPSESIMRSNRIRYWPMDTACIPPSCRRTSSPITMQQETICGSPCANIQTTP